MSFGAAAGCWIYCKQDEIILASANIHMNFTSVYIEYKIIMVTFCFVLI